MFVLVNVSCISHAVSKIFAVFCGLAMHSVMNYEKILKAHARQKVALEVLSFHASSTIEEAERVMVRSLVKHKFYSHLLVIE